MQPKSSSRPIARLLWAPMIILSATLLVPAQVVAQPRPPSIDVLGCHWQGGGVGGFVDCIQSAAQRRVAEERDKGETRVRDRDQRIAQLRTQMQTEAQNARAEADRRVAETRREIESGPRFARGFAEERVLVAARSLNLDSLFTCLQNTGTLQTLLQDVQRTATDPASIFATLDTRIAQQARTALQDVVQSNLREMLNRDTPPTPEQAMALTRQMMQRVAERVPAFGCVEQHLRPHMLRLEWEARTQSGVIEQRQQVFFNTALRGLLEDALKRGLQRQMQQAARSAAGPSAWLASKGLGLLDVETEGIVTRAFVRHMLIPTTQAGTTQVAAYAQALANSDPAARERAQAAIASLGADERMRSAALIDIGVSVLRDVGSKFITQDQAPILMGGADMFRMASNALTSVESSSLSVGVSLAGLVPEGGAATFASISSVLTELSRFAEFMSAPPMKAITVGQVNKRWREFMNDMRDGLIRDTAEGGNQAMTALRQRFPEFTGLMDVFSHDMLVRLGAEHLRPLERVLQERNSATAELVRASSTQ